MELAPGAEDAWWLQLLVLSAQRDVDGLIALLEANERQFGGGFDLRALQAQPDFAWLRKDRTFRRWARGRRAGR